MERVIYICLAAVLLSCSQKQQHLFTELSPARTGIKFKNVIRESEEFNVLNYAYLYNGGGVSIGDINNDQLPDIYFTGNLVASRLYLNKGNLRFEDITKAAGVSAEGLWNTGTTMADVNGDGFLDIYVCRSTARIAERRKNLLFINNKDLTFTESAEEYGLADDAYSTHAAFFDYDCDGDLDAFILNHSLDRYAGFNETLGQLKQQKNDDYSDKLFRNDNNVFTNISAEAGIINNVLGFGLGLAILDINSDNFPDIYVSNDYNEEDYLYVNQKDGTYKEVLKEAMGHVSLSSMGNESGDFNNDLRPDIISLDMLPEDYYDYKMSIGPEHYEKYNQLIAMGFHHQTLRNMLQLNNGNGTFSEIGQLAGIPATYWSWAPLLADFDNDGWKDLFISNGYGKNYLDMDVISLVANEKMMAQRENRQMVSLDLLSKIPDLMSNNYAFKNNGDLTFSKVSEAWGFKDRTLSNGAAYGDLDNDGDLDLVINNINDFAQIYRNNSESLTMNNYVKVQLHGKAGNTLGTGSKIILKAGNLNQYQELMPSRGYQSSMNAEFVFGLGSNTDVDTLKVIWPDASSTILTNIASNQVFHLYQEDADAASDIKIKVDPVFVRTENNLGIQFSHQEIDFIDFNLDKLIPRGLLRKGPGVAKGDINNDGLEDIYIGGARNQAGRLYIQVQDGKFENKFIDAFSADSLYEDTDALFFDADGDEDLDLYVTSGGYVSNDVHLLQDRLYINPGNGSFIKTTDNLPQLTSNNACVTSADYDGDGTADLFVGGYSIPGNYPMAPRSYLLRNNGNGIFTDVTNDVSADLLYPGMVSDAEFANINMDSYPDLILVGEWMKLTILLNDNGIFVNSTDDGLEYTQGWWNTIKTADIDADGDIDLLAGNMGKNNTFNASQSKPLHLYFGDFDKNGKIDPILTYDINGTRTIAYSRDELIAQVNPFTSIFPNYDSFAKIKEKDIFSILNLTNYDSLSAACFETSLFLNDGTGRFQVIALPVEAQFSPVYSIHVLDINSDGNQDIILAGNQSNTRVSTGKFDALLGTTILSDGHGHFRTMDPVQSGLKITGDVRSITEIKNNTGDYLIFIRNNSNPTVYSRSSN